MKKEKDPLSVVDWLLIAAGALGVIEMLSHFKDPENSVIFRIIDSWNIGG